MIQIKADNSKRRNKSHQCVDLEEETAMPISSIIALSSIVAAFMAFAVVLAWADYETRHIPSSPSSKKQPAPSHQARHDIRAEAYEKVLTLTN